MYEQRRPPSSHSDSSHPRRGLAPIDRFIAPVVDTASFMTTKPERSPKRHGGRWIAAFATITVVLAALVIYLLMTEADVRQQRDHAQRRASALTAQHSTLAQRVATLKAQVATLKTRVTTLEREDADLRQQLAAASGTPGAPSDPSSDIVLRTLTMPLSDEDKVGLFLDQGRVSTECCDADFYYSRQDATGRPQLASNSDAPYSTAVKSATVSRDECSQAVATSPSITPIRPLHSGRLICVMTSTGTSLLQIVAAPRKDGRLKIRQKFWPEP